MGEKVRINRYLAMAGVGSRRKCEELISGGCVSVNNEVVTDLATKIDIESDRVTVGGKPISPVGRRIVLILNKPEGVLSTVEDTHKRKTVIDIAREHGYSERLFPVGRLDMNTSGLILITNDGELAYRLTHPRYKVDKTYNVIVEGRVKDSTVRKMEKGLDLPDLKTMPCRIEVLNRSREDTELEVTIREGKKRQVRRMFAHFGHRVLKLHRKAIGDLMFEDVEVGRMRPLNKEELSRLRELVGLE